MSQRTPQDGRHHRSSGPRGRPFESAPQCPMPAIALVPERRKQCSLNTWRRPHFTYASGGRFGHLSEQTSLAHALCAIIAMGRMLDHSLAQSYVEQFHPHKAVYDFIDLPARHATHALPPKRIPSALGPARLGRSFSSNIERARFNRDLTVPTGHASSVETSA